jgi:hypothetical protein
MHANVNDNCEPASFIATFPDEDPGVLTTTTALFGFSADIIDAVIPGLDAEIMKKVIEAGAGSGGIPILPSCAKRCGMPGY